MKNAELKQLMDFGSKSVTSEKVAIYSKQITIGSLYTKWKKNKNQFVLADWFQRGYEWDLEKQVMLLHTLFNTPELIPEIVIFIDLDGNFYLVDGQQRTTTIFRFLDGEIKYVSTNIQSGKYFQVDKDSRDFEDACEDIKGISLKVTIIKNILLTPEEVKELKSYIFLKWNSGVEVKPAQIRGALDSTVNDIIKPIIKGMSEEIDKGQFTKSALSLSNKFNKNKINEILEKMVYHYNEDKFVRDPKPSELAALHQQKSLENKVAQIQKDLKAVINGTVEYKLKYKRYSVGLVSLRDILIVALKLKKNKKIYTQEDMQTFVINCMNKVNEVYINNYKFKNIITLNSDVFDEWYEPYFKWFGKGQDSYTGKRTEFLYNKFQEFISVTSRDEKRLFTEEEKLRTYYKQDRKCAICSEPIYLSEGQGDHKEEHSLGFFSDEENCQIVCVPCHKEKTKNFMKKEESLEVVE
jgi:Protein of unknown function DUF262/HNH endonuclease